MMMMMVAVPMLAMLAMLTTAGGQPAVAASNMTDASGCVWQWQYTPCSEPCGGGTFTRFKQVLERPDNVTCIAVANQTDIVCNDVPCSSDVGAEVQPELRTENGDIVFSVQESKDVVVERGERRVAVFSDLEAQIKALATSLDSHLTSLASAVSAISSTTASDFQEETARTSSAIASTHSVATSQITDVLSEMSRVSSVTAQERTDVSKAESSQAAVTSLLSTAMDTLTGTSLPTLSNAITENTRNHESLSSLVADVSTSEGELAAYVDGQPEFTTMSFGRNCGGDSGGEYYFIDAYGKRWEIPHTVDKKTVLFDAETETGFAFEPSTGGGSMWWMSIEGASGIACQIFGRENDAIRTWHLREATDSGNGMTGTWGPDTRTATFLLRMEYAHCSPDDIDEGLCEHPTHLPTCYSMRLLCFP